MAAFSRGTLQRWQAIAAGVLLASWGLGGMMAPAAEPSDASGPGSDLSRTRTVLKALESLRDSLARESGGSGAGSTVPMARPEKTVRPPTLDAGQVDAMLDRVLQSRRAQAAPLVDDEAFARRVHLDVTGKLPSPQELEQFRRSTDPAKRARLIDGLLATPEYARNWARYWRDVIQFHASNPNQFQVRYPVLEDWLTEQIGKNAPWDEVAKALITASGRNDESGPANFAIAQMGQPVEMAAEVSRIFLGVQIQCAQCHDHPNDSWKRQQFHEFAAFFAGLRQPRLVTRPGQGQVPVFAVAEQPGKPRYTMPDLKDPKTLVPVSPRFFLASSEQPVPSGLSSAQRRTLAASFVTGQDNPWFAKAYINRIWSALIGNGFYTPVDDLGPTRTAEAPEVLEALASQWQHGGYDVRWLFRTLLNTRAYQRESRNPDTSTEAAFTANCPVRLRADQVLDTLGQALGVRLDAPPAGVDRMAMRGGAGGAGQGVAAAYRQQLRNPRFLFNFLFGVDPSTPPEDILGTIPQALFLMNNPRVNRAVEAGDSSTVLGQILGAQADDPEALKALYLRVLARRPNEREVTVCREYIAKVGDRKEAFEDIFWNLINSTEFLSRR